MKRRLEINGLITAGAVLSVVLFPQHFFHRASEGLFGEVIDIFGITFILLGQILRVSARGYKSAYSQNGHSLITGGPYTLVRNPMYLGILLIGLGIALTLFKWWVVSIFLVVFTVRYILLIFKEEKKLQVLFPKDYLDYQQRVPRLMPSLPFLLEKDISEYLPLRLSWLKKESGTILAVLLIALFLESWQDIRAEGLKIYFREVAAITITIILFIGLLIYLSQRTDGCKKDAAGAS